MHHLIIGLQDSWIDSPWGICSTLRGPTSPEKKSLDTSRNTFISIIQHCIHIAWKQWTTLWRVFLTVPGFWWYCSALERGLQAVGKTLHMHATNTHTYDSMCRSSHLTQDMCGLGRGRLEESSPCNLPRYFQSSARATKVLHREDNLYTCNETVDGHNQCSCQVLWVTHTFAVYDRVICETQKVQRH